MSTQAIREYLFELWKQYKSASKAGKGVILNEIQRNLRLHRKTAIRLMNRPWAPRSRQGMKQEGKTRSRYSLAAKEQLGQLWHRMGYMCAERMKAALPEWLAYYEHKACSESVRRELLAMSSSTINRYLAGERAKLRRTMNAGTRRGVRKFLSKVPIRDLNETAQVPGHCEVDCVAHCGDSLSGTFAWTLTLTDIASGWTECEAIWGKDGHQVRKALEMIEARMPFKLQCLYFDNGAEFMNQDVIDWYATKGRPEPLPIRRGRPYKKNDQCYVEQKNYTHVRKLFGYARIDWRKAIETMNGIYRKEWRQLQNFFMPQQKLVAKHRLGAKIKRSMDKPKTPVERLSLQRPDLGLTLSREKAGLDPFRLRHNQRIKVKKLNTSPKTSDRSLWGKMAI